MLSVMIVDDFKVFCKQIARMKLWEQQGRFEIVDQAEDGDEALCKLRKRPVDLLITDIKMPKMNGIELLEAVKHENLCRCVVLLSEFADFEYARRGLVLGAFDYMIKPINPEKLQELLDRCYNFLQAEQEDHYPCFEEQAVADSVLRLDPDISGKLKRFADAIYHLTEKDIVHNGVHMVRALKNVHAAVMAAEPWIDKFVKDIGIIEANMMRYEEYLMITAAFEKFIREMYIAIKQFKLGKSDLVRRACDYILIHSDEKLSLAAVAAGCFSNRTYLSHVFKSETDISFVDYVTGVKCARAKKLMKETDLRIFEIADRLGYEDAEYFSRSFKSITSESPSEYKKRHQTR